MKGSGIEVFSSFTPDAADASGKVPFTRVDSNNLVPGNTYYQLAHTSDETPKSGKKYFTRGLAVHSGTEVLIEEEGIEHNIYSEIKDNEKSL